jgi:protein TonB
MNLPCRAPTPANPTIAWPDAEAKKVGRSADRPAAGRLPTILFASAVIHAAVIAAIAKPDWLQPRRDVKPLQIVLAPPPAPPAPAAPPTPAAPLAEPPAQKSSRPEASPRPRIAPSTAQPLASESTPSPRQIVETAAAVANAEPVLRAPANTSSNETAVDAIAPAKGRPRPDTVAIAEYSRIVSNLVAAHRQYPGIARIRGWQGTTLLEISVDASGHVIATRVAKSSGHDVLDRQAQEMVNKAGNLPPMPSAGREQIVMLQLPVLFALAD